MYILYPTQYKIKNVLCFHSYVKLQSSWIAEIKIYIYI